MNKGRVPKLKDLFVEDMQKRILSGNFDIGEKIPTERELANQMGVSRQVVNSGISELVRRGFLRVVPRHGTYVADYRVDGNINTLNAIMEYKGVFANNEEIKSILEIHWGLELIILRDVMEKAEEKDLDFLYTKVEKIREAETDRDVAEAAFDFEHSMTLICENDVLALVYVSFRPIVTILWERFVYLYGKDALYYSKEQTLQSIREKDKDAIRKRLEELRRKVLIEDNRFFESAEPKVSFCNAHKQNA